MQAFKRQRTTRSIQQDSKPILLVIDDDPFFCAQIKLFACEDYEVYASSGPETVDSTLLLGAKTIVLDLNMPGIDGVEFIKTMAALIPRPQLIIASGYQRHIIDMAKHTAELYGLRGTAILQKPFDRTAFTKTLSDLDSQAHRPTSTVSSQAHWSGSQKDVITGIRAGEFIAHYQPQINLSDNRVSGIEALARWDHPDLGIIPPADFIDFIEVPNIAMEFTLLIMELAIKDCMVLSRQCGFKGQLSINVPPDVFANEDFPDHIFALADKYQFDLGRLICELTERGMEKIAPQITASLTRLKMHDVKLSVDDFGTGQSGLSKLKSRAFDEIKIDRSFVKDLCHSHESRLIVESIIKLGHEYDLKVVAEGIESEEVLSWLRTQGCDLGQGYYFSRPINKDALLSFISGWNTK